MMESASADFHELRQGFSPTGPSSGADYPLQGAPQKSCLSIWKPFRHGERKDEPSTRRLRAGGDRVGFSRLPRTEV